MVRSATTIPHHDGVAPDCARASAAAPLQAIGKIRAVAGSVLVVRANGATAQAKIGDPVFQGDGIETAADGAVDIAFQDGTRFGLSAKGRMVVEEFACDTGGNLNCGLLRLVHGAFAFIAGRVAKAGSLCIDTPVATIRSRAQGGGMGALTLAAFTVALIQEVQAAQRDDPHFLQDDTITPKDMPHGVFEIVTKEAVPRTFRVDDPGQTFVLRADGSGVSVQQVANSPAQMAAYQEAAQAAQATYSVGQQDPFIQQQQRTDVQGQQQADVTGTVQQGQAAQSASSGSSGTLSDTAPATTTTTTTTAAAPPQSTSGSEEPAPIVLASATTTTTTPPVVSEPPPSTSTAPNIAIPAVIVTAEDQGLAISGFSVADADSASLTVTLTATSTLTLASTAGLTFTAGDGSDDETMTFSGSVAAINAALDGVIYTPTANFFGTGHINYWVSDGSSTISGTVDIAISDMPDDPVAQDDVLSAVNEDSGPRLITAADLLLNDTDADNLPPAPANAGLTITQVANPVGGTVAFNGGNIEFTPAANFNGAASFTYTINDGTGRTDTATVTFAVNPVNDPPTASPVDLGAVAEDGSRIITAAQLLAGVSDIDTPLGNLTITSLALTSANGTLVDNGGGSWTYTPAANDDTAATFSYTVSDGQFSASSTASLDITPVNDAPVVTVPGTAVNASQNTPIDLTGATLTDPDLGDVITVTLQVSHGTLVPLGNGDGLTSVEGIGSSTLTIVGSAAAVNAAMNAGVTYTPDADFTGADELSISASDGHGGGDDAAVTINVQAEGDVNDDPTTAPVVLEAIAEDSGARLITQEELLANADDVDGGALTAVNLAIAAGGGQLVDNLDGTWSYTPAADDDTSVTFSYQIEDGAGGSVAGSATLDITPVNDDPTTAPVVLEAIAEDSGARLITQEELLANADDVDGGALTAVNLAIAAGNGQLVDNLDGTWSYTPAADDDTSVTFSYQIEDGAGGSVAGSATLDITPVNDDPVIAGIDGTVVETNEDTPLLLAADVGQQVSDVDAGAGELLLTLSALHGSLVPAGPVEGLTALDADGSDGTLSFTGTLLALNAALQTGVIYTPAENYFGVDTFTLTVNDQGHSGSGGALSDTASVTINVASVNDAPNGADNTKTILEDATYTFAAADFVFSDIDSNAILAVKITTLPLKGVLRFGDNDVEEGDTIPIDQVGALTFVPDADETGAPYASFTFQVQDDGGTANGGIDLDATANTFTFNVTGVNNAPTVTVPAATPTTAEDVPLAIDGFSVVDIDSANLTVTLTATSTLTLASFDGLAFSAGDGSADATMTFSGSIAAINAALDGLTYTPTADFFGTGHILFSVTDDIETVNGDIAIDILPVNDDPTGAVAINGAAAEDQTLTVDASALADADGLGVLHYQWQRDNGSGGWDDVGADQDSYTLGDADVGRAIRVVVSYTDGQGTLESVTSAPTAAVANVNDAPSGVVTIEGTAAEDATLTADASALADADGLGVLHYQWQRADGSGGWDDVGADQDSYTLGDADVGRAIRVVVSYTDGQGTLESVTSAPTAAVANVNDAPEITSEAVATTVTEDQVFVRSGHLAATDADNDALVWSLVGGGAANADYFFRIDDLNIIKNSNLFYHDGFDGGGPPPSAPDFPNGNSTTYFISAGSTFIESTGRVVMFGPNAFAPTEGIGGIGPIVGHSAILSSNIDPDNLVLGLKSDDDFTVEARFDLMIPDDPGEGYGVRLTDRIGDPVPGDHDNDVLGLIVRRSLDGTSVEVALQRTDFSTQTITTYESYQLDVPDGFNQIVLRLTHDLDDPGAIVASFDVYNNGGPEPVISYTFDTTETIFHGENWTRVEFRAISPAENVSVYASDYGVLTVDQDGNWQYVLRNGQLAVQQLGEGDSIVDHFTVQVSDGNGGTAFKDIDVTVIGTNDAPAVEGDLAVTVANGSFVVLTTDDFRAVDPDNVAGELTFSVSDATHGFVAFVGAPATPILSFTQADLEAGSVIFVHDGSDTVSASFKVSVSDGSADSGTPTTVLMAVPNVGIRVQTTEGYNVEEDDPIAVFGGGVVQNGGTSTTFTVINAAANREFVVVGTDFDYDLDNENALIGGTILFIQEFTHDETPLLLAEFNLRVDAQEFYDAALAAAFGDHGPFEALSRQWSIGFAGNDGNDAFGAGDANDGFRASGGSDFFEGGFGFDRANYTAWSSGPIYVQLADGLVTKYANIAKTSIAGTDTLRSIEFVTGTDYVDTFDATGFSKLSPNAGSTVTFNTDGALNEFEGRGGNDIIIGNGQTRISYLHATAGVTVYFTTWVAGQGASGTASGDDSVGTDTFTGVSRVRGSNFDDVFNGSNNPANTTETYEGRGGDDTINGGGGPDRAVYLFDIDEFNTGIVVNLAAGTVIGGANTGNDTLHSIEFITGTNYDDIYDATGFTTTDVNGPNFGSAGFITIDGTQRALNEFEGAGGDDEITGNGNTRIAFSNATDGVVVSLATNVPGSATGAVHRNLGPYTDADPANVGTDTIVSGVSRVRGSEFSDSITGNAAANTLEGRGGNDSLSGLNGNDTLIGGTGADRYIYSGTSPGVDVISDFDRGEGVFNHDEGDRIDLRSFAVIAGLGDLTIESGTASAGAFAVGAGPDTRITNAAFGGGAIILLGVAADSLDARDFIFAGQAGVTVYSPNVYDFSTLYDDLAGINPALTEFDSTHYIVVNPDAGLIFSLINNAGFTYEGDTPTGGNVSLITIYDLSFNFLAAVNGLTVSLPDLLDAVQTYADTQDPSGLDTIFITNATYNAVGSSQPADGDGTGGADTFISSANDDVFNGLTNANGDFGGGDTVDYSCAPGPVTVDLTLQGAPQPTGGAGNDTLFNIENLRGSSFGDQLTGDGNNNVLEGGPGNDTLDGGGGNDTASYEHAPAGVTVSLALQGIAQDTGGAGTDTLTNFENLRGSAFNDTLTGNGNSMLEGLAGADHLIGQPGGNDFASYEHAATPLALPNGSTITTGVTVNLSDPSQNTGDAAGDSYTDINNLFGSRFADNLTGNDNDNVLNGFGTRGDAADVLTGLGGADIFMLSGGRVTITDFTSADGDRIDVSFMNFGAGFADFAELQAAASFTESGGNTTIDFGDGNSLTLLGVQVAQLQAGDFILHF